MTKPIRIKIANKKSQNYKVQLKSNLQNKSIND